MSDPERLPPAAADAPPDAPAWSPARRIVFRFVFSYLVLYNLPFPLDAVPPLARIVSPYDELWAALVPWVATHLFHADASVLPNGSGDTTYNYVQVFCFLAIASIATAVWTLLAGRRADPVRLEAGLRIYVRFALAAAMISYGAVKVVPAQFPAPQIDRLLQPMGDASPMGLAWTFLGSSTAYAAFGGAAELLGGLLLSIRRTTFLGALVSLAVLVNVVALNVCYDIPVKLYSSHLLAMAVFLLVPDLRRLVDLLVLGRGVVPAALPPLCRRLWLHRGALALRTLLVLAYTADRLYTNVQDNRIHDRQESRAPLSGLFAVDEFALDGQLRPPLVTDPERWRWATFHLPSMAVQRMSDSRVRYTLAFGHGTIQLSQREDPRWKAVLSYARPGPGLLTLEGTLDGRQIRVRLHAESPPPFQLTGRGFHWINERPFNR